MLQITLPWQCCDIDIVTESCPVGCGTGEGMLFGGVLVQVGQGEHLVQVDVQQAPHLVDQLGNINRVHSDVVTSIIADTTS